jgi:hypothetical protein
MTHIFTGKHSQRNRMRLMTSEEHAKEGRRSRRILVSIPLEVQPLPEPVKAVSAVINLHGALILSVVPWPAGTALHLRNQKTNRSIERV